MSYEYPYADNRPLSFKEKKQYTAAYAEQVARDTVLLEIMRVLLETPMENRKRSRYTHVVTSRENNLLRVTQAQAELEQSELYLQRLYAELEALETYYRLRCS